MHRILEQEVPSSYGRQVQETVRDILSLMYLRNTKVDVQEPAADVELKCKCSEPHIQIWESSAYLSFGYG